MKPWVTKGIKKTYVSQRQNLQTNGKGKDQLIKTEKHKNFKKYRNKITDILKQINRHITTNILKRIKKLHSFMDWNKRN